MFREYLPSNGKYPMRWYIKTAWAGCVSASFDPFGKVWVRGAEFHEILKQIPKEKRNLLLGAHRKVGRDEMVRQGIRKYSIFD